ncbi:MAG: hypothetical protein WC467_03970 [Patescibacteria group bacterium]
MFGLRKTVGSVLLLVVFLALATLATFFYNADQAQKEEITKNDLFQKGQATVGTLLGASLATSETMADANLQKNIGLGKTMADMIAKVDWQGLLMGSNSDSTGKASSEEPELNAEPTESGSVSAEGGFWSNLGGKIKNEWAANQDPSVADDSIAAGEIMTLNEESAASLFNYQKTDSGAEIVITPKNGALYKIALPFKFLSRY